MFYDESARIGSRKSRRRLKLFRLTMTGVMIVLLAPIAMLAMAPLILMSVPLALVVAAIMVPALIGGGHPKPVPSARVSAWQFAPANHV